MPASKVLPTGRMAVDVLVSLLVVTAAFIALTTAARWDPSAVVWFIGLCAIVSFPPRRTLLAFAALLGPPLGVATWPQACVAVVLLAIGPVIVSTVTATIETSVEMWRKESASPIGRLVLIQIARPLVRGIVVVCVASVGFVEGGWFLPGLAELVALVIPLAAYARGYYKCTIATAICASMVTGWSATPLILAALSFALEIYRLFTSRMPRQWHPLPKPSWPKGFAQALRCAYCDRKIAVGDLLGARRALGAATGSWISLRRVFLDLEEHTYQSALTLARQAHLPNDVALVVRILQARALSGIAQYGQAGHIYRQVLADIDGSRDRLLDYVVLLLAENDLAAGRSAEAGQAAAWLRRRSSATCDFFMRQRALRLAVEVELERGELGNAEQVVNEAMDALLLNRAVARLVVTPNKGNLVRRIYGSRGSVYIHLLRVEMMARRAEAITGEQPVDGFDRWEPEAVALSMVLAHADDDLVDLYLSEARTAAAEKRYDDALSLVARALMELDRTRYSLAAQSSRTSWSKRFHRVLDFALEIAHHRQDHEFVAELLEFARVQTLPTATAEGSSDLALTTPPVVLVKGCARLARPGEAHRSRHVDLEYAAARAAGRGAWWLSYWATEDWLYWALLPPSGEAQSGRIGFQPHSALRETLHDLELALPVLLPGEHPAEADFRIDSSPLLADPRREIALSGALGNLLLPHALVQAAAQSRSSGLGRLPLAIAPIAPLGYVPWSILVAGDHRSADPERLIDVCDWVLAPSAALICNATVAAAREPAPLALVVADTTEDAALGALPGARAQAEAMPHHVRLLGGAHWSTEEATLARLEHELRTIGINATVAFMCHAVRGSEHEPAAGGIVLAPADPANSYDIFGPQAILAMHNRGITMPAQVILQACDTSALKDTVSGEWLTIVPALIAAGAREVIATLYPLPDLSGIDDPIVMAALRGENLQNAVARTQREGLVRWTSGHSKDPAHTPLAWAAYATVAVQPEDACSTIDRVETAVTVTESFMSITGDAFKNCQEARAGRLDSGYLLGALLDSNALSELLDGAGNSLKPSAFIWTFGPYICSRFLFARDQGPTVDICHGDKTVRVPLVVIDALKAARVAADRDGLPLTPHHVLTVLLAEHSAASRIMRWLSALSRNRTQLVQRAIEYELGEQISRRLTPHAPGASHDTDRDLVEALLAHTFAADAGHGGWSPQVASMR